MLETGQTAPLFELADVEGKQISLAELFTDAGKPVLAVIFKVSCPTCQLTLPYLERLWSAGIPVLGVSQDDPAASKAFAKHFGLTFPIVTDAPSYHVSNAYKVTNVPSMFLLEKNGAIEWSSVGFIKAEIEGLGRQLQVPILRETDKVPERKPG